MSQDWFAANAPKAQNAPQEDWFATNAPKKETPPQPKPEQRGWLSRTRGPEDFPVYNLGKGAVNVVRAIPGALYDFATDVAPYDASGNLKMPMGNTASALWNAHAQTGSGAIDALQRGDYATAARKGVNTLIPVLGPAMDASTDKMMQGNVAEGIGEVVTNAALTAAGMRPRVPTTTTRGPRVRPNLNPKEAEAVAFARQQNIPLDAGTATGRQFLKNWQKKAASSYGGANTADAMQTAQTEALTRVGGDLAGRAGPKATNPVAAGEGVRSALTKQIQDLHAKSTTAYERLRQFEEKAVPDMVKANPAATGADAFNDMQLAVNLRGSKQALAPVYKRLLDKRDVTGQLLGSEGRAAVALKGIMEGPDFAPLSVVDAALGDIKALARGAEMPELRNAGQSLAARAVQQLDAQVRARASRAGADVLTALEEGRAATKQKYATAEVLDMLSGEPGQVFKQLTQNKDIGLERLKAVQKIAPNEIPNVARAFLEDMLQQATSEGGFAHADRLFANWQKLGSGTKQALFPKKGQIQALDHYFLLAKRIKDNPNPSGTAQVMNATNVLAGIPMWALAKMLYTPEGVKFLTQARVVSKSPSKAGRAVALTNLTKAAQSAGVPLEAIPALAEEPETPRPSGTRR